MEANEFEPADLAAQLPAVPTPLHPAILREADSIPFVDLGDGSHMQLLHVDLSQGIWVVRMRFEPGCKIDKHYHTGPVFAFTVRGAWHYLEYPEQVNREGSYLFEPAGSVHTLAALPDGKEPAEVWFTVFGANVNIDDNGNVINILDAATVLGVFRELCRQYGYSSDNVIVAGL